MLIVLTRTRLLAAVRKGLEAGVSKSSVI